MSEEPSGERGLIGAIDEVLRKAYVEFVAQNGKSPTGLHLDWTTAELLIQHGLSQAGWPMGNAWRSFEVDTDPSKVLCFK